MGVIAFHGQGATGARLLADMGRPEWVTWAPDWQNYASADAFAEELGGVPVILVGYSLGGEFIAKLTRTQLAPWIEGIAVYESPVRFGPPRPLDCPAVVIWNNYTPRTRRRREGKAASIAAWNLTYPNAHNLMGLHECHFLRSSQPPFLRHAWDQAINPLLADLLRIRSKPPKQMTPPATPQHPNRSKSPPRVC